MAKKKTITEESGPNKLDIVKKSIIKKYGEGVISTVKEYKEDSRRVISTGCLGLDSILGTSGLACGKICEIYGPNSSGKSTLALSTCMQALLKGMTVVYIDVERALDVNLVKSMGNQVGANTDNIIIVKTFTGDDFLQIAEDFLKSGAVDVLVIDSVSALLPVAMAEADMSDNHIGLLARLMSKACVKLKPVAAESDTLLIFINQTRADISVRYGGGAEISTGGNALPYYSDIRIQVTGGKSKASLVIDDNGEIIGHKCNFQVVKNKLSRPWRTSSIELLYGVGYNTIGEVVELGISLGYITQSGAWFEIDGKKVQGKNGVMELFKSDEDLYKSLFVKIKNALGLKEVKQDV